MVFFVAQAVAAAVIIGPRPRHRRGGAVRVLHWRRGHLCADALRVYAKAKTEGVPQILGGTNRPLLGLAAGLAAGAAGVLYLFGLDALDLLEALMRAAGSYGSLGLWIAAAGAHRGAAVRGVHLSRTHLRRPAAQFRRVARDARERRPVRHRASGVFDHPGVHPRRLRGAGLRTQPQPAGADDRARRVATPA